MRYNEDGIYESKVTHDIISYIDKKNGKEFSVTQMAKDIERDRTTISEVLGILEEKDVVNKSKDGRRSVYYLTEKGNEFADIVRKLIEFKIAFDEVKNNG